MASCRSKLVTLASDSLTRINSEVVAGERQDRQSDFFLPVKLNPPSTTAVYVGTCRAVVTLRPGYQGIIIHADHFTVLQTFLPEMQAVT